MTMVAGLEIPTPECDKALVIKEQSQAIGWLHGWTLCRPHTHGDRRPNIIEGLLCDYFEIDKQKMEDEKRTILEAIRRAHVECPSTNASR